MDRVKMSRQDRAKQFAPFDALKGLQNALRIKEYEHDKIAKGELSEDDAKIISDILINLEEDEIVKVTYFDDGYNKIYKGKISIDAYNKIINLGQTEISLDNLLKIEKQSF